MGRNSVPTALKKLRGNPGQRRLPENEPVFNDADPKPPLHLNGVARDEWNRVFPQLANLKLVQAVDRAALEIYCTTYADYVAADIQCAAYGLWCSDDKGNQFIAPWANLKIKLLAQMRGYLREFGFTPSSRVDLVSAPRKESELEAWRKRKKQA